MPPPFGQFFRKNSGDSPTEPAGNEDLERGHGSRVLQKSTASGYQSSPSRVYLPETQSIHASMVPQTPVSSHEYFSRAQYNGQHGSAAHLPLTPSGPSRVVGYLPRTIYSDFSSFVGPTRLVMPFLPSQNASNVDFVCDSLPPHRSTSMSSIASHRTPSPRSPFDPGKHGQALRRLETHGSLKTIPSGENEGDALNHTSISLSEMGRVLFEDDHAPGLRGLLPQRPESRTSADPCATADQQSGADLQSSQIQDFPNSAHQGAVLGQRDTSENGNLPDAPRVEGGKIRLPSFVFPLPNAEPKNTDQLTQQAVHWSQVPFQAHKTMSSISLPREPIAADTWTDLRSKTLNPEGINENDTNGNIARKSGNQRSEQIEGVIAFEAEREEYQQGQFGNPIPEPENPAHTFDQSPTFEEIDEYLWSPAPSNDGQEASSAPHPAALRHAPSESLRASPISGLTSETHGGFSRSSKSYGNAQIHSLSGSSGKPRVIDSSLPHIDVLIPAGNMDLDSESAFLSSSQPASMKGGRESSSILFRYSGVITDGASSRPMSEIELKEEVLNSLGAGAKAGVSKLASTNSSSQVDCQTNSGEICGEHAPIPQTDGFPLYRIQNTSANSGPGSSQTSSSLSTDRHGGGLSGYKSRLATCGPPSSKVRCPTPPLLFGKYAIGEPVESNTMSRPAFEGAMGSPFNQNARAIRLDETGHLPTALCSLGEQDWETVSPEDEANAHPFDGCAFNTKTGSSLADNSDSGSLSLSMEMPHPFRGVTARPVIQHPAHPRHNHSFMLLKNSQTGELVQVPQYEYALCGRLPNNNASTHLASRVRAINTYQHPSPLPAEHNHPFTSSPIVRFTKPTAVSTGDSSVLMQQDHSNPKLSYSGLSEDVQEIEEKQTRNPLYKTSQDTSRIFDTSSDQDQHIGHSKEQSRQSSAWLSTVSEVASSEPSFPGHKDTVTVWDANKRVNSVPERGYNREAGSSLADASSPGANFSSSPVPLLDSSPIQVSGTPPLSEQLFHKAFQHDLSHGNHHLLVDSHKSLETPFNREDSAPSSISIQDRYRSHSASGPRLEHLKSFPRRRRSSSESHPSPMDSPSAKKASAPYSSSSDGHARQNTSTGLLLRNPFLHSDDDDSRYKSERHNLIERRGRQPKADDASNDHPTTPSSTESRPFVRDGVVHTDTAPPIFDHPVYGRDRPWDRLRPGQPRPRPHPNPLGRPLFQRPVARAESPHLHRVPRPPTRELLERHVLLSRIYLIACMVIPPIALLYGHGYMDGVIRFHTEGDIHGFRNTEKAIALLWGYGLSAICILAIVVAMIVIFASG